MCGRFHAREAGSIGEMPGLLRNGNSPHRYAPGTEEDPVPGFLFEKFTRLFHDVRRDPGAPRLERIQQGADPQERPIGSAKPINGVEVHARE